MIAAIIPIIHHAIISVGQCTHTATLATDITIDARISTAPILLYIPNFLDGATSLFAHSITANAKAILTAA